MIFGADRNVTTRVGGTIVRMGQSQRSKVLKWPNRGIALHYVGQAAIDEHPTDLWLYDFVGRHLESELGDIAVALADDLDAARSRKEIYSELVLHLGAFAEQDDDWRPQIWFVHNTEGLDEASGTYHVGDSFTAEEQIDLPGYFGDKPTSHIRQHVASTIFQFQQGNDLGSFGVVDEASRGAMHFIERFHPQSPLPTPTTLSHWEDRVRFSILTYGAFFSAFYEPYEQFVGGGADTTSIPWPAK
jgi:hypothetical protein